MSSLLSQGWRSKCSASCLSSHKTMQLPFLYKKEAFQHNVLLDFRVTSLFTRLRILFNRNYTLSLIINLFFSVSICTCEFLKIIHEYFAVTTVTTLSIFLFRCISPWYIAVHLLYSLS